MEYVKLTVGVLAGILVIDQVVDFVRTSAFWRGFPAACSQRECRALAASAGDAGAPARADEQAKQQAARLDNAEARIGLLEQELILLRQSSQRQGQLLARLVHALEQRPNEGAAVVSDEVRSDADFVDISSKTPSRLGHEASTWTPEQVVAWVERTLGTDSQNECFTTVDGATLCGMYLEYSHGLSFADKLFFMGVDKDACVVLQQAMESLIN